jgi:hypothetical protein
MAIAPSFRETSRCNKESPLYQDPSVEVILFLALRGRNDGAPKWVGYFRIKNSALALLHPHAGATTIFRNELDTNLFQGLCDSPLPELNL